MDSLTTVIMIGSGQSGDLVQKVTAARMAAATDSLAILSRLPGFDRFIVAHSPALLPDLGTQPISKLIWEPDPPTQEFHFGQRLAQIVDRYQLSRLFYLGAGSQPLLPTTELAALVTQLSQTHQPTAITNNIHSADWVALNAADKLHSVAHWLNRDNMLAWRLREDLGYHVISLPPSAASRFDIDTPFDLQVLALHPETQAQLRAHLKSIESTLGLAHLQRALQVLRSPGSRITVIGRVSAAAADLLGSRQLWTRVFAEERGMAANRRQAEGQVFSFIADHIDRVGEREFIAQLSRTSDLVLFDTRVYMAHHHLWPTDEERFASDLGLVDKISDARLRRLTEAAFAAPIPILLGGHNVVSGGLYALLEIAALKP